MSDYPSDADLSAYMATQIFFWNGVRWNPHNRCYAGTRPDSATLTPVPDIVNDATVRADILQCLVIEYGLKVSLESKRDSGGVLAVVGSHDAEGATLGQALCRAAWPAQR